MAIRTIEYLLDRFGPGDAPRSADYIDLIDTLADDRNAVYFGSVEPTDTAANPLWFDTENNQLSIYSNGQWFNASSVQGLDGDSAYEIAISNGFVGTESQWLASLVGPQGPQGERGVQGIQGEAGAQGIQGISGIISVTSPITNTGTSTEANIGIDLSSYYTSSQADSAISTAIANLVDSAPATLDTLNELAAALGDDPNFATTVTNAIAAKADSSHTHAISDVIDLQTSLDAKAVYPSQTGNDGKYLKTNGSAVSWELVGGGLFPIWGERNGDPLTGQYFAFGNGSNSTQGVLVPETTIVNSLSVSTTTAVTGTLILEVYKNGSSTGKTVSLTSGNTKAYASGLNLSIAPNDNLAIYTAAGGVGGGPTTATIWLVNAGAIGPEGPPGKDNSASLSGAILTYHAERTAIPAVGAYYAFGNGSSITQIRVPASCKLVMGTFQQSDNADASITVEVVKNGSVNSSYSMSISGASGGTTQNWYSSPLSFAAGDTITWRTSSSSGATSASVVTFYLLVD